MARLDYHKSRQDSFVTDSDGNTARNVELGSADKGAGASTSDTLRVILSTDSGGGGGGSSAPNVISTNNSSTATLGAGATFEGTADDVGATYAAVAITVYADQDSAADGLQFQFSSDNVNWDDSNDFNLDASVSNTRRFQFPVTARYFRVRYTNGGTIQGAFRLQTILHTTNILPTIHRLDTGLSNDRSVTVVKSVIAGETTAGGGGFVNVKCDPAGKLETNATQDIHDDLNLNANLQINDADASTSNAVPVNNASAVGITSTGSDWGAVLLAKHQEDQTHLTTADGEYDILSVDSLGSLHVNAEAHHIWDQLDATTGWTVANDATSGLATTTNHILGSNALTFDKVNGSGFTEAYIEKTVSSVDLGDVSPHDIFQTVLYLSDTSNVEYIFCRLGTDSSNYNEWRIDAGNLTQAEFEILAFVVGDASFTGNTGNGWDQTAVTYISLGVSFTGESNTLSGIIFDQFSYHTNQHTTTSLNAEVSSSVSSPNVKVNGWAGSVATNTGNASNGTLRVVTANDSPEQAKLDNILTELQSHATLAETQPVSAATLPLPAGAATSAGQLADNHQVTISNASLAVTGPLTDTELRASAVDIKGEVAEGDAVSGTDPLVLAGQTLAGNAAIPTMLDVGPGVANVFGALIIDSNAASPKFRAHDETDEGGSTKIGGKGVSSEPTAVSATNDRVDAYFDLQGYQNNRVIGQVAHNAANTSENDPVLGGTETIDYASAMPTEITAGDLSKLYSDLSGLLMTRNFGPRSGAISLSALNLVYDDSPTSANSADIDNTVGYSWGTLQFTLSSTSTPTRILFYMETKNSDGSTYHRQVNDFWNRYGYEDTGVSGSGVSHSVTFRLPMVDTFRIAVVATGTDSAKKFTITVMELYMGR